MVQLHGPNDWTPDEEREALALAKTLGIKPEEIRISIPAPPVETYRDRQARRASARGEYLRCS